ncbi:site-specific integrase [Lactococcus raffinolactis]|uniref:site-specific integrase n=1 Tax=Pseudolactococcus raffinolactis TaxID=1366 RepID=UPI00288D82C0|nr:site-specific integrase [Lactococcus raffinolactis]MDT2766659.1 site-specific integrase [Lactococcus raffinolactis]MDT2789817.1 site-specific integrase [Lactococcus raffinolactis]
MASTRYRQRGKKKLWLVEIRQGDKTLDSKSGFRTKKDAQKYAEPILQKIRNGNTLRPDMTLVDLYQEWLDLKIIPSSRQQTTINKFILRKKIIKKYFGNKKVSEIKPSDYQKAMNDYGTHINRNGLGRLNNDIHNAITMAIADKVLIDDFTVNVELYSTKIAQNVEDKYLQYEADYNAVIEFLIQELDYHKSVVPYVIYFLFRTGMRYAELIALTWEDIDFDKSVLKTYRRYNTGTHKFVPPKNKTSIRTVPIDEKSLIILKSLQDQQKRINKELGMTNDINFVFQHNALRYDIPLIESVSKAIKEMLKSLNIKPLLSTKGARHTYGSVLLHRGIDMGVVARLLGHKDISMLIEVYGHTLQERVTEEYQEVRNIFK